MVILLPIYILLSLVASKGCVFSQLIPLKYSKLSEDGKLTYPELATKYGHPATSHDIVTKDGYILAGYRIPGNVSRPVLLIHGNTPTADCFIGRGYGSPSITLANLGYDVWAINLRGSRYSRKHVSLDPDTQAKEFFNYTFYEQALEDMPATIDYILKETGQKSLIAIGHSIGTTLLYVLGAEKPEYNEKIKLGISLAPISFVQNSPGVSFFNKTISFLHIDPVALLKDLNIYEIATHDGAGAILRALCIQPLGYELCVKALFFPVMGADPEGIEPEFVSTFLGHYPGGTSTKYVGHLLQIVKSGRFAKFDYGEETNMREYGSVEPPEFDLSKVTMDTSLIIGANDLVATVKDAELLRPLLPNVVHYQVLPYKKFNHADFVYGRHMNETFFPYLLKLMKKYD